MAQLIHCHLRSSPTMPTPPTPILDINGSNNTNPDNDDEDDEQNFYSAPPSRMYIDETI